MRRTNSFNKWELMIIRSAALILRVIATIQLIVPENREPHPAGNRMASLGAQHFTAVRVSCWLVPPSLSWTATHNLGLRTGPPDDTEQRQGGCHGRQESSEMRASRLRMPGGEGKQILRVVL